MNRKQTAIVGLTGGIAAGKSVVAGMFSELGAAVIDADALGHEVIAPGGPAYDVVVSEFGKEILNTDGSVNREALGAIVFSNAAKRAVLEMLTHPPIIEMLGKKISAALEKHPPMVVVESAILFEKNLHQGFGTIIVVHSDQKIQKQRLMERSGLGENEALERINSQMPVAEKARLATYVIDNSGTMNELRERVKAVFKKIAGVL
jgi:dephospho-CoA kinase